MKISYVFPYVRMDDPEWIDLYKEYFGQLDEVRFRDYGYLKYVFRSIEENAPFIDEVVLLVSSESQVPEWVDKSKIRIVLHSQFIPEQYLPTFNSNTIEMFLHQIPGIEYIIYANDDFFFNKPCTKDDFFTKDGQPINYFKRQSTLKATSKFKRHCKRAYSLFFHPNQWYLKPHHTAQPMRIDLMREAFNSNRKTFIESITRRRKLDLNYSQYIYLYYAYKVNKISKDVGRGYGELAKEERALLIKNEILNPTLKLICVNDTGSAKEANHKIVLQAFNERYPVKSRFEL